MKTIETIRGARCPRTSRQGATLPGSPAPVRHAIYYNDPDPAD